MFDADAGVQSVDLLGKYDSVRMWSKREDGGGRGEGERVR